MKIIIDKIASVTKNIPLEHEVELGTDIMAKEGSVIAVEVLKDKKIYNQLELTSGRMATLYKGDIVIVALGNRRALKGYVGEVPKEIKPGDIIHLLNLGGVAGICTSANISVVGYPLKIRVLGAVLDKQKKQINLHQYRLFESTDHILLPIPLILISGTCMNVGKTTVACEIIKSGSRHGFKIFAAKMAGIAALKDSLNMEDHGAKKTVSMIDAGYTSSIVSKEKVVAMIKGAIRYLAGENPDYIVLELGDGIFGEYGVLEILKDKEIQKNLCVHIGCAHDPMGAVKMYEICKEIGAPIHLVSGPVTDNSVGIKFVKDHLSLKAINGQKNGSKIFPYLLKNYLQQKTKSFNKKKVLVE